MFVSFLSDFGYQDDFVGTCHGVIKRIAPDVQIVDVTHGIAPQAILQGALVLRSTLPYLPQGVHLAVVDPGVGSARRGVVLQDAAGELFVGPDNGLLVPAAELAGPVAAAYELTSEAHRLESVSYTFHGRDVFAPAAAHLALGLAPSELGPALDPATLVRLDVPEPEIGQSRIRATVLYVDYYGNVQLNLTVDHLAQADLAPGAKVEVELATERYYATAARTFADVQPGDLLLYEDAYGNVSIAIHGGDAARLLKARPGQELRIHLRL
jgi:S-adenosyl-L-methionine hydrolase (adenosine-forming)